jgi:uncharacterized protein
VITRHVLARQATTDGVSAAVVERDYVLAHIVAQLSQAKPDDGGHLIFKGGTALRFVHLVDFRYSADLDFSVVDGTEDVAIASLAAVLAAAQQCAKLTHLALAQGAMTSIEYIGPLGAAKPRRIKLDVSADEYVESVEQRIIRDVWPDLPEPRPFEIYSLDEIAAEKLRCVLQRVQCRDLYDLYRLSDDVGVNLADVQPLFRRKAETKGLDPASFRERFEDRVARYKSRWSTEMTEHLGDVPRFDDVVRIVRRHLRNAGMLDSG